MEKARAQLWLSTVMNTQKTNILLPTSQVRGIDSTGGLGEVPVGLGNELLKRGDIDLRLADYYSMRGSLEERFPDAKLIMPALAVRYGDRDVAVDIFQIFVSRPPGSPPLVCYFFRCAEIFERTDANTGKINKDTPDKVILFCSAVMEFIRTFDGFKPHVVHCNDWQTSLVPVYIKTLYKDDPAFKGMATLYTTHNAGDGFQGSFSDPTYWLEQAGLDRAGVFESGKTLSLEHHGRINLTKGGIAFADLVNTVSITYRAELLTRAFAGGLHGVFLARGSDFDGIVNGIDDGEWNPAADKVLLPMKFSAKDSITIIQQEKRHVRSLLREWIVPPGYPTSGTRPFVGLRDNSIMIAVVSRIDRQKVPILYRALSEIMSHRDVQLCILGDAHPNDALGRNYADKLDELAKWSGGSVLFWRGYDEPLSHLLYASSEVFIVASGFEPCGLTQLIAMRYGSIPIVRSTGGLRDTVIDEADPNQSATATGFLFKEEVLDDEMFEGSMSPDGLYTVAKASKGLIDAVHRALRIYRDRPERWRALIKNGMLRDSSWGAPSLRYLHLYQEAFRRARLRS